MLDNQFKDRVVEACPTSDPLVHRAQLDVIGAEYLRTRDADIAGTAMLNACPGLTREQRKGYWLKIQNAGLAYRINRHHIANAEYRRRAAFIQSAGRSIMEIDRTQNTDRIRQDINDIRNRNH